jgi:hypothetical protein
MPTITINGKDVTVGDEFMKLSQDQQHSTIDEIAKNIPKQTAPEETSSLGEFVKSAGTGVAETAANYARGEQIESEQRAMAFTDKPNAGPEVPTGDEAVKKLGLHKPEGFAGSLGELTGEAAVNPLSYIGPGGVATKALMAGGSALGGATGKELGKGTVLEPITELLGSIIGGVGAPGSARAISHAVSPSNVMAADLTRAIQRDGDTAESVLQRLQEARQIRPNATVADVGGENVRGLTERVAQTPGAGRSIVVPRLTEQQQQQMQRVSGDLGTLLDSRQTALQATRQTMEQRATTATPLYEAAYNAGDREIWSPQLERLSSSPSVQAAMRRAVGAWRDQVVADGYGAMNPTQVERGGLIRWGGAVPVFPNLQFWDYAKGQLDDMVRQAVDTPRKYRRLTRLAIELRNSLDQLEPAYRPARNAWEGPTSYMNSIEEGRNILSNAISPEEMAGDFAEMSEANQEGYRIGALSAIRARMGNDPAKMSDMTKYLRSPAMREKIAAIMPTPEAAESWRQRLGYEIQSSELTGQALRGSATARRLAEREDGDSLVGDLVKDAILHGPTGSFWLKTIMSVPGRLRDTLRSRTDRLLAEQLVQPQSAATTESALAGPSPLAPGYVNPGFAALYAMPAATQSALSSPLAQPGQ